MLPSGNPDRGLIVREQASAEEALSDFVTAIGTHRHHARETDPPLVRAASPTRVTLSVTGHRLRFIHVMSISGQGPSAEAA